ncbi:hypothetical protein GDO81_006528 [Engystomops pustulosus]|uniref:Uncharacterized protein n=1 Tax=Engystomops pustulosus TaxID=76066 RepID=A0AAV7CXC1_ENGPU|nr:hypothetical protein GDO81_006528 [Engystomops pustulosus]
MCRKDKLWVCAATSRAAAAIRLPELGKPIEATSCPRRKCPQTNWSHKPGMWSWSRASHRYVYQIIYQKLQYSYKNQSKNDDPHAQERLQTVCWLLAVCKRHPIEAIDSEMAVD